jgi:hypothetical protein
MNFPEKIIKARQAACAAVDELRDGVRFALIAGSNGARIVWPPQRRMALVDSDPLTGDYPTGSWGN